MLLQFSSILSIPTSIAIIKEIEEVYPTWTTAQLIYNLRFISSLDNELSETLFTLGNGSSFLPKGKLTQVDLYSLTSTIAQQISSGNGFYEEVGISIDPSTGRKVSLGHAISGISAVLYDWYRSTNNFTDSQTIQLLKGVQFSIPILNIDGVPTPSIDSPTTFELLPNKLSIDSLYAMTIAGDIARTITGNEQLWTEESYPVEIGGIGTEASSAELYGNIDGFWMGTWLRTDKGQYICERMNLPINHPNNVKLSTLLGEYYGTIKIENRILNMTTKFGTNLISNLRFSNLLGMMKDPNFRLNTLTQVIIYQLIYSEFTEIGKSDFENSIKAWAAFESWCVSEFNKLRNASILSRETGESFSDCIDEYGDLSCLNLDNYFKSELSDANLISGDFISWYPRHNLIGIYS